MKLLTQIDGTVKEVHVDAEPDLDPGKEKFSKWGSQDSSDARVLNWTVRFNLAKDKLENIILKDRWSSNQEYVADSLALRTVEDVKTWSGDVSAQEYLDSFHVLNNGFDLKIKTLQKLMYINYKTRLKTAVKESTDPVNAVWLTVNNGDKLADNYRAVISLVGGKGKASGETEDIPTVEPLTPPSETELKTPNKPKEDEKPKEEVPTVTEKPKEQKPEDKPKEETPKVETPKETEKPTPKEETQKETPKEDEKPKEDEPKVEQPKSDTPQKEEFKKDEEPKTESKKNSSNVIETKSENKKQANENRLPNTGTESNSMFTVLSVICFMLGIKLKRTEN